MQEAPVLAVLEVVSVEDPAGLKTYVQRASELIGPRGGELLAQGGVPIDGPPGFAPLVIQRWPSEAAFRAWLRKLATGSRCVVAPFLGDVSSKTRAAAKVKPTGFLATNRQEPRFLMCFARALQLRKPVGCCHHSILHLARLVLEERGLPLNSATATGGMRADSSSPDYS